MKIVAVILAGGAGSRIGGGKPARLLGGRALLDWAVERAGDWSDIVAVALRDPKQSAAGLSVVLDDPAVDGPVAGLGAGLRFARQQRAEALLTLPVDMPFLPDDLHARLRQAIDGHAAAIVASGGRLHPVCGLWRTSCLDRLDEYIATGRRSLHGFAEAVGFAVADWPAEPDDPFFNINSRTDLAAAECRLAARNRAPQ